MEIPSKRPAYVDYLLILAGTFLMALAINSIFDPINLVTGGVTGLAIIVKDATKPVIKGGVPLAVTNAVLNVPLFFFSYKTKGFNFIKRTLFATASLTVALAIVPGIDMATGDYLLSAIFGGLIAGCGMGLVFLAHATTGGTDMLAALLQYKLRHYSVAQIMQVIDGMIVVAGAFIFGINKAMYAIIAIYLVSQVTDRIIEGLKFAKLAYIISDKYDLIAKEILEDINRGVTKLNVTGMYSNAEKNMLFCVVSKKEIVQIKEIVNNIDPGAFFIVSDAREVFGEGFIEYKQ